MNQVDLEEVIYKRRTIRRFKQDPIPLETLKKLIDFARVAPVGSNIQALEYVIVNSEEMANYMFPLVRFAASLPKEQKPTVENKPMAYIIILVNTDIKKSFFEYDIGAAVENILLGAITFGLGCCWMASINGRKIKSLLEIPDNYQIVQLISMGFPDEESVTEPYSDSFKYWKDESGKMHVPKRALDDIIFKII